MNISAKARDALVYDIKRLMYDWYVSVAGITGYRCEFCKNVAIGDSQRLTHRPDCSGVQHLKELGADNSKEEPT